ncbi:MULTISPECIES: L,D-transpeptidase family protein [Streptomyces]|uniref:L,D-transpeptidase family protein n=1 Tax=Streptomyces TaxID=1883 RepID=UPI00136DE130|nr:MULTISPECIES: L,D-transpeptidase family protein [unclassified Streptomyces]MBQ0965735.1 murein L,D-transpeptidase [Streptomyces sp. RK74B]MBQ1006452.1 murein L,D-transpeptidase [Streptomyces sp. RK23]MZG18811.1 L,D-transpeptidase family protein [Streptomyces sp. SID5914]
MRGAGVGSAGRVGAVALGAVLVAGGCTVQGTGPDGKGHAPVRIEVTGHPPKSTPSREERPPKAPSAGTKAARVLWERGDTGRDIRELQARLRQVEWLVDGPTGTYDELTERAVSGFQGKRGLPRTGRTDTVTWQRLLGMSHEPGKWDLYLMGGQPAAAPDPRCTTGRVLCVSKSSRTLRWMIDGRTVSTMSVRFGSQYTPTREGVFQVYWKSRHHVSTLYDSAMPYAMFFSGGQAVHYSYDFAAHGYAGASHGCVNVRDEAAIADLYAQVRNGDKVVVYW